MFEDKYWISAGFGLTFFLRNKQMGERKFDLLVFGVMPCKRTWNKIWAKLIGNRLHWPKSGARTIFVESKH